MCTLFGQILKRKRRNLKNSDFNRILTERYPTYRVGGLLYLNTVTKFLLLKRSPKEYAPIEGRQTLYQ